MLGNNKHIKWNEELNDALNKIDKAFLGNDELYTPIKTAVTSHRAPLPAALLLIRLHGNNLLRGSLAPAIIKAIGGKCLPMEFEIALQTLCEAMNAAGQDITTISANSIHGQRLQALLTEMSQHATPILFMRAIVYLNKIFLANEIMLEKLHQDLAKHQKPWQFAIVIKKMAEAKLFLDEKAKSNYEMVHKYAAIWIGNDSLNARFLRLPNAKLTQAFFDAWVDLTNKTIEENDNPHQITHVLNAFLQASNALPKTLPNAQTRSNNYSPSIFPTNEYDARMDLSDPPSSSTNYPGPNA
jgi:hypothetical protein